MQVVMESDEVGWQLLRGAPIALVAVASTGRIELVNEHAELLFGWAEQDLLGQTVDVLVPESARFSPDVSSHPVSARRRDGSTFSAEISCRAVDGGDDVVILAAVRDVSDRVEQERLHRQETARIAHDFNNLLGVILNYATLVAREVTAPQVAADVEEIRAAAERATALTRQLLAGARHDAANQDAANPEPPDV